MYHSHTFSMNFKMKIKKESLSPWLVGGELWLWKQLVDTTSTVWTKNICTEGLGLEMWDRKPAHSSSCFCLSLRPAAHVAFGGLFLWTCTSLLDLVCSSWVSFNLKQKCTKKCLLSNITVYNLKSKQNKTKLYSYTILFRFENLMVESQTLENSAYF